MSIYQICDPGYELLKGEIKKKSIKKEQKN